MKQLIPKVTVLIPAYNAGLYMAEAINSVLNQTFTDFDLLIINDGSTDHTESVIRSFNDRRIHLINQVHSGIACALNRGLSAISSTYVARFDADDICLPGRLKEQVDFLDTHPDHVLVGSDAEYISENGEHLFDFECMAHSDEEIREMMSSQCPLIHSAVMYRKEQVLTAGGYSPLAHNFEDYLLWVGLKKYGAFHNLRKQLIRVRFNPSSVTIDEKWRGRNFRKIKRESIRKGSITPEESTALLTIITKQANNHIKEGAYYALCGKKFLVDNYQPSKARPFFSKAILACPYRMDNYAFYLLSYLPGFFISWIHKTKNGKFQRS